MPKKALLLVAVLLVPLWFEPVLKHIDCSAWGPIIETGMLFLLTAVITAIWIETIIHGLRPPLHPPAK